MKKKIDLTAILSMIHLFFVLSIVCFGTAAVSFGILLIPSLTSAFAIGKNVLYRRYDVYDSVFKTFFHGVKEHIGMMRYFPLELLALLQLAGCYAVGRTGMSFLLVPMLACSSFIFALIIYIAAYHIFYAPFPKVTDVIIAMLYRLSYFFIIWILMILLVNYLSLKMLVISLFIGALALFMIEIVAFLGVTAFKKLRNELNEDDLKHIGEEILKKL